MSPLLFSMRLKFIIHTSLGPFNFCHRGRLNLITVSIIPFARTGLMGFGLTHPCSASSRGESTPAIAPPIVNASALVKFHTTRFDMYGMRK